MAESEAEELLRMKADELEKTEELLVTTATELEEFAETGESSSGETVGELQAQNAPNKNPRHDILSGRTPCPTTKKTATQGPHAACKKTHCKKSHGFLALPDTRAKT